MTGNDLPDSPSRTAGAKTPARDSRGRWVRRTAVVKEDPEQDFVFDDRIIEATLPAEAKQLRLRPDVAEGAPDSGSDAAAGSRPTDFAPAKESFDPPSPAVEYQPEAAPISRRNLSPPLWLIGAVLLLGTLLFVFKRGYLSAGRSVPIVPQPAPAIVAPTAVPAEPKQTVRRPATRAPAAPLLREDRETAAPPHPDPPVAAAGESVPPAAAPAPTNADEEGWFDLAEEYLQLGDETRAEALYRRILAEGSQQGRAALALGDLFAKRNDFNHAQEFYRISKRLFQAGDQPAASP